MDLIYVDNQYYIHIIYYQLNVLNYLDIFYHDVI